MKLHLPRSLVRARRLIKTPVPGFDPVYYLYWYPDVRAEGSDPLEHYLQRGWKEGRDPSGGFSTSGYLAANPDVAQAGHNPLLHFLNNGFAEGRGGYNKDPMAPPPSPRRQAPAIKLLAPPAERSASIEG